MSRQFWSQYIRSECCDAPVSQWFDPQCMWFPIRCVKCGEGVGATGLEDMDDIEWGDAIVSAYEKLRDSTMWYYRVAAQVRLTNPNSLSPFIRITGV